MDGHPLSSVECRWRLIHRLLHHAGSTCTTHTVFTLGLQPPLPLPMKSSNLGVGEAKCINATHDLPASFNTTGLTGIAKLSGCHLIHSTHWLALFTPLQPRDGVEFSPSLRVPIGLRNPNLCTYHADLTLIPLNRATLLGHLLTVWLFLGVSPSAISLAVPYWLSP